MHSAGQAAKSLLKKTFDHSADFVAVAPGRVNLIGEHVDYNDGIVLPFAIDRYTSIAAKPSDSNRVRLISEQFDSIAEIVLFDALMPIGGSWTNYIAGVIAEFQARGYDVPGFDAAICSNIPSGSGLSSSAALEVATATLLEGIVDVNLDKAEKALICQSAEHKFAGVPCGIMDQFASVFGVTDQLIKIDCQTQDVEMIPTTDVDQFSFVVTNSLAKHSLADGEYAARKQQTATALKKTQKDSYRDVSQSDLDGAGLCDIELRRSRHVITEIERTTKTAAELLHGQWGSIGELLYASHDSLRDDYEVSCEELDFLVQTCREIGADGGVIGSRMTGGGFGGCTITLARTDQMQGIIETIQSKFSGKFGCIPPAFATRPSTGTTLI